MSVKINNKSQTEIELVPCPWCETDKYLVAGRLDSCRFAVHCSRCNSHGPVFGYSSVCDSEGVLLDKFAERVKESYHDIDDYLIERAIECWNQSSPEPERVHELLGKRIEVPHNGELETGLVEATNNKSGLKLKTDKNSPHEGNTIWVYPKHGQVFIETESEFENDK